MSNSKRNAGGISHKIVLYMLAVLLNVALFAAMMTMKADVAALVALRQDLHDTSHQLREDLRVLEAEYAHLTNPIRLQQLAQSLQLQPVQMTQILPWRTGLSVGMNQGIAP